MDLDAIQRELRARGLGGWLFFDHHHRDPIAYRILGLPDGLMVTRRWYYLIPATGAPRKLVHRIEAGHLDTLPGEKATYAEWPELGQRLGALLAGLGDRPRLALQYSPGCMIPAISLVDAGTVEQLRGLGCEPVSSGDLISRFDATWSAAMLASHRAAGKVVDAAIAAAFVHIREALDQGRTLTEHGLQQWLVERMQAGGLAVDEPPIVAVNAHAGDPHYMPAAHGSSPIAAGDLVLLDVWGKTAEPGSAYYDVTWMGYCRRRPDEAVPTAFAQTFALAAAARDAGVACVTDALALGRTVRGCDVDQATRAVIAAAGLGAFFVHRTGHSIGTEVHSTGANMDNFETRDEREILPRTCFSVEPGIYRPEFGVRTEVNVYIGDGGAEVTGPVQRQIVRI